jgi:exosortase/archaeosortase family protein
MQFFLRLLETHLPFLVVLMQDNLAWLAGSFYGLFGKPLSIIGNTLLSPTSNRSLFIGQPCLGLGMCAGMIALQLSIRSSWHRKLIAIFFGLILLQLYNCIRITHLFSILENHIAQFNYYHLFIWQSFNIVFSLMLNVILILLFHPKSAIARAMHNTRVFKILASIAVFTPGVFIKQALAAGGGGGGGGGGINAPFIALEQWQIGIFIGIAILFIKHCQRNATH